MTKDMTALAGEDVAERESAGDPLRGIRTLYISYNGISEPLVRSQVLNYQERLAAAGAEIHLLTFERSTPPDADAIRATLRAKGIAWEWKPYSGRRGAMGTLRDVRAGARYAAALRERIDFIHCRSFIPALMGYWARRRGGPRYLYDLRDFWAHEKRYKGKLGGGVQFAIARLLEAHAYRGASAVVTLTDAAMRVLKRDYFPPRQEPPNRVIPTCVDLSAFPRIRAPLNPLAPKLVYSGSLGAGYLCDELFLFFRRLQSALPDATLEVVSLTDRNFVQRYAEENGVHAGFSIRSVRHEEIPAILASCDAAISFMKPGYARIASCPTKMAEYLAAGLPVVSTKGIGDVDSQLLNNDVGVIIDSFTPEAMDEAIAGLRRLMRDPAMIERGRRTAEEIFSLERGVARYAEIYAELVKSSDRSPSRADAEAN